MKYWKTVVAVVLSIIVMSASCYASGTRLRGVMISPSVKATDIQYLGQTWKVNFVRWQLNWTDPAANSATLSQYRSWLSGALQNLDNLLPICEKAHVKVLIDLHSLPGGRDSSGVCRIFTDEASQREFVEVWKLIARRYAGNSTVWGYDLANEPTQGSLPNGLMRWNELATTAAQGIRAIDNAHTIVVQADQGANPYGFAGFAPLPPSISNVTYSVHMYLPHKFTHQGVLAQYPAPVRYPGVIDRQMWDKARLRAALQPVIDFQRKYNVPIYVGEFSAARWAPAGSAYNYLRDVIAIFEENGWDWTYHSFREWQGWSVEHTEDKRNVNVATKPTNRERLLRSWFSKNQQP